MKFIFSFGLTISLLCNLQAQDTVSLIQKPNVILKSWHPEFKEFPALKWGTAKVLYITIPDFEKTLLQNNDIELRSTNTLVDIKKTDKTNQYLIKVLDTNATSVEFEAWLNISDKTILLKQNSVWQNIKECYPYKDNRIMIQSLKLKIE